MTPLASISITGAIFSSGCPTVWLRSAPAVQAETLLGERMVSALSTRVVWVVLVVVPPALTVAPVPSPMRRFLSAGPHEQVAPVPRMSRVVEVKRKEQAVSLEAIFPLPPENSQRNTTGSSERSWHQNTAVKQKKMQKHDKPMSDLLVGESNATRTATPTVSNLAVYLGAWKKVKGTETDPWVACTTLQTTISHFVSFSR